MRNVLIMICLAGVAQATLGQTILRDQLPLELCSISKDTQSGPCIFAPRESSSATEDAYRTVAGEPDWQALREEGSLGVALSGGGSKAAAYALGILAGLDDQQLLTHRGFQGLRSVDAISSVSGGGYSAYHLFSRLVWLQQRLEAGIETDASSREHLDRLFHDHVTHLGEATTSMFAMSLHRKIPQTSTKYPHAALDEHKQLVNSDQYILRCAQDLLQPGECASSPTSRDKASTWGSNAALLVPTVLTAIPHHIANTVFDSGWNLAPSKYVYQDGIGMTYGAVPLNALKPTRSATDWLPCPAWEGNEFSALSEPDSITSSPIIANAALHNCRQSGNRYFVRDLSFRDLQRAWQVQQSAQSFNMPFWIVQASSTHYRSILGWFASSAGSPLLDTFEFTPMGFGSRRYGFVAGHIDKMTALDAVSASAAFFDANQQVYVNPVARPTLGVVQHLLNVNWGVDIPNYSVGGLRRNLHRVVPFPLNGLDSIWMTNFASQPLNDTPSSKLEAEARGDRRRSSFIRLVDGGSSENTAAIALLRRGLFAAIVSDGAQDIDGAFGDLCLLKNALEQEGPDRFGLWRTPDSALEVLGKKETRVLVAIPVLKDFDEHCLAMQSGTPTQRYSPWAKDDRRIPALIGCVTADQSDRTCSNLASVITWLLVFKPTLDHEAMRAAFRETLPETECHGVAPCRRLARCVAGRSLFSASGNEVNCATTSNESDRASCRAAFPCEAMRLQWMSGSIWSDKHDTFPQTATVGATGNFSGTLMASYRELSRWQVNTSSAAVKAAASKDSTRLSALAEEQARTPWLRTPIEKPSSESVQTLKN